MKKFIISIITVIILLSINIFLFLKFNPVVSFIYVFLIGIAFIIFLFSQLKKQEEFQKENYKSTDKLNELYKITDKLLNLFCIYFDNSFLLIHSVLNDNKELQHAEDDFIILHKTFKDFNDQTDKHSDNNVNQSIDKTYSTKQLIKKINPLIIEIDTFIKTLESVENNLFTDIKNRINTYIKKENFQQMVVEYEYYSEMTREFINSIINNINTTLKPLSEEILIIKQNVNEFVNNITTWKEELTSEKKGKSFNNVISQYDRQNEDFNKVSLNINNNYKDLDNNLHTIVAMIEKVFENSHQIQDIAEKIQILSINAAIESSRAGKYGQGFKVISNEIKKLSQDTQAFTDIIVNEINDTKDIAEKTMMKFEEGCKEITEKIDLQKSGFLVFYAMLTNYYEDFNKIFSSVSNLTENISKHINKFNPIFQLHDTSIQGLGNLNEMITKFLEENKEAMDKIIQSTDQDKRNEILNKLFSFVEDKITTDMEIEVVNKITKKYDLDREIKYSDVTVDMF